VCGGGSGGDRRDGCGGGAVADGGGGSGGGRRQVAVTVAVELVACANIQVGWDTHHDITSIQSTAPPRTRCTRAIGEGRRDLITKRAVGAHSQQRAYTVRCRRWGDGCVFAVDALRDVGTLSVA
jgi:hypothetical protein